MSKLPREHKEKLMKLSEEQFGKIIEGSKVEFDGIFSRKEKIDLLDVLGPIKMKKLLKSLKGLK